MARKLTLILTLAVYSGACGEWIVAQETPPNYGENVRILTETLKEYHFTKRMLDDDLSAEWLAGFIRSLDPRRMYFLQSDIDEFTRFSKKLDELARDEDFEFPELVRDRLGQRATEMSVIIEELLAADVDFTIDEEMPREFEGFAQDAEELRERWRQRIKLELLIEKLHGRELADVRSQLSGRYARIANEARDMTDERLYAIYANALVSRFDSDSQFLSDTFMTLFEKGFGIPLYSLGLGTNQEAGRLIVRYVNPGILSVDDTGLIGWELIAIRSETGKLHDVVERHRDDVQELIISSFGPLSSDSHVTLEVLNPITLERRSLDWFRYEF